MNANKVTVAMLKAAGFKLVDGDGVWFDEPENEEILIIEFDTVDHWNEDSQVDKEWIIKSLAPRGNDGTQPVADDCVVEVILRDGEKFSLMASGLDFDINNDDKDIITWTPHLPSILEQQMNIDKSALELTERDIEDAFIQQDDAAVYRELAESDEWVNGDVCSIEGYNGEWQFGCDVPNSELSMVFRIESSTHMTIPKCRLIKPLTPEQLAAKEREEFIREIIKVVYPHWNGLGGIENDYGELWGRIYDAGYRK